MKTSDFEYDLPVELIAQEPSALRGASRMMVVGRSAATITHKQVADLPHYLRSGDLLVLNDTKVFPARLLGHWADTGGAVELLLLEREGTTDACWRVLVGSGRPVRPDLRVTFADGALTASIVRKGEGGEATVSFDIDEPIEGLLDRFGTTPLPPYIHRAPTMDEQQIRHDRERYQTVYAREVGAVAAPTAGLHLTDAMFDRLQAQGIACAKVTLHVGPGTFKPVTSDTLEDHRIHTERYTLPPETITAIHECHARKGRVVAVGSTTVRTLETVAAAHDGELVSGSGRSSLFIFPPYKFRVVDVMLTNFHLPRSTLLMMVSAFAGHDLVMRAYAAAVQEHYAFFSYGDCMLLQ